MRKNWSSLIKNCSLNVERLAVFADYFENRNLAHVQMTFIDNVIKKYTFSPTRPESIIIVSSNTQIEIIEVEDDQQEYIIDVLLLDTTRVNFLVNQKSNKITYRFFLSQGVQLYFDMAIVDANQSIIKIICHLLEMESSAELKAAFLLNASQKISLCTEQHHHGTHTKSDLLLRGFVTNAAQILHQGIITIDEQAQQTQASQQSKILLGSMHAQAKSIPSLEIKAHDVRCQHGSAIGYLDEQQLFYMQSRGFDELAAQKMLVEALFSGHDDCLSESIKEKLNRIFRQQS